MHIDYKVLGPLADSYSQEEISAQKEGEQEFVLRKQRATNILIEVILKMIFEVTQTSLENFGLVAENWGKNNTFSSIFKIVACL